MNPCRNQSGEIICENANLPYCRQTCEVYAEHEKARIEISNTKVNRAEDDVNQYFRERHLKIKNKIIRNRKIDITK